MAEKQLFDPQNPGAVRVRHKETGQTGYMMRVRDKVRFFPDEVSAADDVGIGGAMMTSAGQMVSTGFDRINQLFGADESQEFAESEKLLQPLRDERPFSTSFGQGIPAMAIPGGKAIQTGVGALEGALLNTQSRVGGAIEGGIASLVGGEIGERAFRTFRQMFGGPAGVMAREGLPMTRAQRGNAAAQAIEPAIEAMPFLNRWASAPARAQQQALNRSAAEALGFSGRQANRVNLTRDGLNLAKRGIQSKFREVEAAIPDTDLPPEIVDQLKQLNVLDRTERQFLDVSQTLDGEGLMRVRSALNQEMADLALDGKTTASRGTRVLLNKVDEIIEQGIDNPAIMDTWRQARQQWRFLTAITRGKALSADGTVNLASARNAINTIYPNFRTGGQLPGQGARFGELLAALDELPRTLQSSGTAERGTAAAILAGAGALGALEPATLAGSVGLPTFVAGNLVSQPGAKVGAVADRSLVRGLGSPIEAAVSEAVEAIFQEEDDE